MEITSVNTDLVKETVKLQEKKYREETGKFLLEGFKAVEEAYLSGLKFDKVFLLKYEEISLEYTVYLNRRIIVLDELNPCELLDNLLDNYDIKKDKNVSGEFSYDKMFKINLIDLMGEDEE